MRSQEAGWISGQREAKCGGRKGGEHQCRPVGGVERWPQSVPQPCPSMCALVCQNGAGTRGGSREVLATQTQFVPCCGLSAHNHSLVVLMESWAKEVLIMNRCYLEGVPWRGASSGSPVHCPGAIPGESIWAGPAGVRLSFTRDGREKVKPQGDFARLLSDH